MTPYFFSTFSQRFLLLRVWEIVRVVSLSLWLARGQDSRPKRGEVIINNYFLPSFSEENFEGEKKILQHFLLDQRKFDFVLFLSRGLRQQRRCSNDVGVNCDFPHALTFLFFLFLSFRAKKIREVPVCVSQIFLFLIPAHSCTSVCPCLLCPPPPMRRRVSKDFAAGKRSLVFFFFLRWGKWNYALVLEKEAYENGNHE